MRLSSELQHGERALILMFVLGLVILILAINSGRPKGGEITVTARIVNKQASRSSMIIIGKSVYPQKVSARVCIANQNYDFCTAVSDEIYSAAEVGTTMTFGIQGTQGDDYRINWVRK